MPIYCIRDIPPGLWEAIHARAKSEKPPDEPIRMRVIMMRLLRVYARHGLAAIEKACPPPE